MTQRATFRPQHSEAWEAAFDGLYVAAVDSAEFAHGLPTGRSRTASLKRLAAAVAAIDELARRELQCPQNAPLIDR